METWKDRWYVLERAFVVEEEGDNVDMEAKDEKDVLRLEEALSWRSRSENRVVIDACKVSRLSVGKSMSIVIVCLRVSAQRKCDVNGDDKNGQMNEFNETNE